MNIGIIGLGLIGTSLALSLRKNEEHFIWGVDREQKVIEYLKEKHIFGALGEDLSKFRSHIQKSDLIFISVPPSQIKHILEEIKEVLTTNVIVSDTGSVKGNIMDYVNQDEKLSNIFIGGHPLAGREGSGPLYALDNLFEGKIYFLTPAEGVGEDKIKVLREVINYIGGIPYIIDPNEHDNILAYTSHLPQIIAYLLSYTSIKDDTLKFLGSGFKDTTRIAKSDPDLWLDIVRENLENVKLVLMEFDTNLSFLIELLEKEDFEKVKELFSLSQKKRFRVEGEI